MTAENVATPATALTVVVPLRTAPPGFVAKVRVTVPENVVIALPLVSCTATTGAGVIGCPATVLPGEVLNASWLALPATTLNGDVVALASEPLDATRVKPVPSRFTESPANVATPLTAFTEVVPLSTAPVAFPPSAMLTAPLNVVAVLPFSSCTVKTTVDSVPPAAVLAGCVVTTSFVATTGVAVALKVADPATPAAVAASVCAPAPAPTVHVVCALPFASVATVLAPTEPPLVAAKLTSTPLTPPPSVAVTRTATGRGRVVPTVPVWPEPDTTAIALATGWTMRVPTSVSPPVRRAAVICTVPRPISVVPLPDPADGSAASAEFDDEKMTGVFGMTLLVASNACAVNWNAPPAFTVCVLGLMTTLVAFAPGPE